MQTINFDSTHPFFNSKPLLLKLCRALFSYTPIKYFSYMRYYYNGSGVALSHRPELEQKLVFNNLLPRLEELHRNTSKYIFLSGDAPIPEVAIHPEPWLEGIKINKDFGINHRLAILFYTKHYVETFVFGIDLYKKNSSEIFINHLNYLESFIIYFRDNSCQLLIEAEKGRILFDTTLKTIGFNLFDIIQNENYLKFLSELYMQNLKFKGKNGFVYLSKREFECLFWLTKGKTAKHIAQALSLSPRTVEGYLENLKNKLNCNSKSELIEISLNNAIIRDYIYLTT